MNKSQIVRSIIVVLLVYPYSGYLFFTSIFLLVLLQVIQQKNISKIQPRLFFTALALLLISSFFYILSSKDFYFFGLTFQILLFIFLGLNSSLCDVRKINMGVITGIIIYSYIIIIPSIIFLGPNLYLNIYNTFLMEMGSSVYISNLLSSALCLILIQWFSSGEKNSKRLLTAYFFLVLFAGFLTGSRTFIVIFGVISLGMVIGYVKNSKYAIGRLILPMAIASLSLLFIFGIDNRLTSDGISSSRFAAWASALDEYKLLELQEISSLDEKYLISAFHNIILDAFYLYGEGAFILLLLYSFVILAITIRAARANIKIEIKFTILIAILSSIMIAFTSIFWRGDTNQVVILLGISFLFANNMQIKNKLNSSHLARNFSRNRILLP